jgi:hypothetical protein
MARATDSNGVRRFSHVEIEICTHCDCSCWGCDRFVDACPTGPMTVDQVGRFVNTSCDLDWEWDRIHVLGGEPTLHRDFRTIIAHLIGYRARYPNTLLRVISNGRGNLPLHRRWLANHGIEVAVEGKCPGVEPDWFNNTRMAPVDEGSAEVPACGIFGLKGCGLGLTKHGFFLCGAGASIARAIGADIGVMRLEDVTHARMLEQAKSLCHLCGHWTGPGRTVKKTRDTGLVAGPFWEKALTDWKPKPMTLYGESE